MNLKPLSNFRQLKTCPRNLFEIENCAIDILVLLKVCQVHLVPARCLIDEKESGSDKSSLDAEMCYKKVIGCLMHF